MCWHLSTNESDVLYVIVAAAVAGWLRGAIVDYVLLDDDGSVVSCAGLSRDGVRFGIIRSSIAAATADGLDVPDDIALRV